MVESLVGLVGAVMAITGVFVMLVSSLGRRGGSASGVLAGFSMVVLGGLTPTLFTGGGLARIGELVGGTASGVAEAISGVPSGAEPSAPVEAPTPDVVAPTALDVPWSLLGAVGLGALALVALTGAGVLVHHYVARSLRRKKDRTRAQTALEARLVGAKARHQELSAVYGAYLCDLTEVFKRPALNDVGVKQTGEFVEAYARLTQSGDTIAEKTSVEYYENLVSRAWGHWRTASEHADRVGLNTLPAQERKRVERAIMLLTLARDSGASESERVVAYQQAMKLVEGVVRVPEQAQLALETQVRLALPAAELNHLN